MTNRFRFAAVLLWTPAVAAAQALPVPIPKALIFPNYDSVLVGQNQALEGGAYIARAGDASANFYNPAGLVVSEKTSLNASSTGYIVTRLNSEALQTSISSTKIDSVPGYFGVVVAPPFTDARNLRIGASVTRGVAWSPGGIDQTTDAPGAPAIDRATYSTNASFATLIYQIAAAWAPVSDRSFRLGLGLGLSQTSYSNQSTFSGQVSTGGQPGQFLSTLRATGDQWDMIFTLGAQWEIVHGLTVGALVRSAGLRIGSGFHREVRARLGGVHGCTHIIELLGPVATTAFQTMSSGKARDLNRAWRARMGHKLEAKPKSRRRPPVIDTCHAWASDGPVVRRWAPDFYTGPDADAVRAAAAGKEIEMPD